MFENTLKGWLILPLQPLQQVTSASDSQAHTIVPKCPLQDSHRCLLHVLLASSSCHSFLLRLLPIIFLENRYHYVFFHFENLLMAWHYLPNKLSIQVQQFLKPQSNFLPLFHYRASQIPIPAKVTFFLFPKHFLRFVFTMPLLFVDFLP